MTRSTTACGAVVIVLFATVAIIAVVVRIIVHALFVILAIILPRGASGDFSGDSPSNYTRPAGVETVT